MLRPVPALPETDPCSTAREEALPLTAPVLCQDQIPPAVAAPRISSSIDRAEEGTQMLLLLPSIVILEKHHLWHVSFDK